MLFALLIGVQAAEPAPAAAVDSEAAALANCTARKFETTIQGTVNGKPKSSKVKLCGKAGQTDAEWRRTLTDALDKVAANPRMSRAAKEQLIAALKLEIAKLDTAKLDTAQLPGVAGLTPAPPLTGLTPPPRRPIVAPSSERAEYATLPPMPAPKPAVSAALSAATAPSLPPPRLTLRCLTTSRLSTEDECDVLERETLLTVRAGENLANGTSLRFLRRGDARGEIDLPPLRAGQSRRFTLPPTLCAGVAGSRVQIEVVRAVGNSSQVVDTRGPFELRC